jgi:hypothetical protein
MPKFFIPTATDSTKAEEVYTSLRRGAEKMRGGLMSRRRIFRIDFRHDGKPHYSEVGKPDSETKYLVLAIFEDQNKSLYLAATSLKNGEVGYPMIGASSVYGIDEFDQA